MPEDVKENAEPEKEEQEKKPSEQPEEEQAEAEEKEGQIKPEEVLEPTPEPPPPPSPPPTEEPAGYEVEIEKPTVEKHPPIPAEFFRRLSGYEKVITVASMVIFVCAFLPWRDGQLGIGTVIGLICFLLSIATVLIVLGKHSEKLAVVGDLLNYAIFATGGLTAVLSLVVLILGANGVGAADTFLAALILCGANYMQLYERKREEE